MRVAVALLSAFICVFAGLTLLSVEGGGGRDGLGNVLGTMSHGIGLYCIGKGIYVGAALWPAAPPKSPDALT